jgi:hypothetical protein
VRRQLQPPDNDGVGAALPEGHQYPKPTPGLGLRTSSCMQSPDHDGPRGEVVDRGPAQRTWLRGERASVAKKGAGVSSLMHPGARDFEAAAGDVSGGKESYPWWAGG